MPEIIHVEGLTNAEFFERHAAPGRIGLYGGPELINRMIGRAQRHLSDAREWSRWSHAFLFQGRRHDGHHWIVESDLDIHRKHIRLGVQENRVSKYHDDAHTTALAIIDLGLTPVQVERVTPWWRSAGAPHAGDTVVSEAEALSVPKVAGWPLD